MAEEVTDKEVLAVTSNGKGKHGLTMSVYADGTYDVRDATGCFMVESSLWRLYKGWLYFRHARDNRWHAFSKEGYDIENLICTIECEMATRKIFG